MTEGVLLIGGSASVGKTTLAGNLAAAWPGVEVVHVDDLRRKQPQKLEHFDRPSVWDLHPKELLGLLLEMTASIHGCLIDLVTDLVEQGRAAIVEGEGVEPGVLDAFGRDRDVRAVYVVEDDPSVLWQTFASRASGARFLALTSAQQAGVVEMNRLYSEHLRKTAAGGPHRCIPSQPWPTLAERVLAASGLRLEGASYESRLTEDARTVESSGIPRRPSIVRESG